MNKRLIVVAVSFALSACGGGGGGSSPAVSGSGTVVSAAPTVQNPTDPYTNQPATGTATTSVSGVVMSNLTAGATVTAYAVQPDGSNGETLGTSAITGADGKYTLQLTKTPLGMVRFVATGGTFVSEADGSTQKNTALELVTPYVTTDLNSFVITPLTHIVSHVVSYKAKNGATLASAYTSGVGTIASLSAPNLLKDDANTGITLLKTVPGSSGDTLNTYQDILTAIEWYGVRYDLPSSVVVRVLASNAENGFPGFGVDGANTPINVGKWVGGVFDQTIPFTLDEVTAWKNPDGTNILTPSGQIVHDYAKSYIATNLIQYVYRVAACANDAAKPALFTRYPNTTVLFSDPAFNGVCAYDTKELADLKARIQTNNRSK